jgi:AcrR family transcriptional regulator
VTVSGSKEPRASKVSHKPSLREAQKQFTHKRLLSAAEREMYRRGYSSTTIDDIADAAGATRGTFYLHFSGKADVIIELVATAELEFHPLWELLRDLPIAPSRAEILDWLTGLTHVWKRSRERTHVIFDAVHAEPDLHGLREQWRQQDLELLYSALGHMAWESESHARVECMLLLAELERAFEFWNAEHDARQEGILLDVLADRWWRSLNRDQALGARGATVARGRGRPG